MIIQHHRISISQILISSVRIEGILRITMDCLDTVSVFWVFDWVHAIVFVKSRDCMTLKRQATQIVKLRSFRLSWPINWDLTLKIDSKLITLAVISRCRFGLLGLKKMYVFISMCLIFFCVNTGSRCRICCLSDHVEIYTALFEA